MVALLRILIAYGKTLSDNWESVTRRPLDYASKKAYLKQLTVLVVQVKSPKRLLQLFETVSSSVSFLILLNCLVRIWTLYLWVKRNPKKSILEINAVKLVYVESCYKIFISAYKKSNYNDDISNVSDLPFDEMCLFIEWKK